MFPRNLLENLARLTTIFYLGFEVLCLLGQNVKFVIDRFRQWLGSESV